MMTTNDFREFSGGIFQRPSTPPSATGVTKNTLYRYPHLVGPDMFSCSYAMRDNLLDIVGYSKVKDDAGAEVLCIVHYTVNLALTYRRPVFYYEAGGEVLFTYSRIRRPRNIVVRAGTTEAANTGLLYDGLEESPLTLAANKAFSILIFQKAGGFMFAISTVEGKAWSYYDDIDTLFI